MKLTAVGTLPLKPHSGIWYRAVRPQHAAAALPAEHTPGIRSRFSPGPLARRPFRMLYLVETPLVALLEVLALFGSPVRPGGFTMNRAGKWSLISVRADLSAVADLTGTAAQTKLETSAQELTGDWPGYHHRGPAHSVQQPVGIAPTQQLGEALFHDSRQIEGFLAISAKVPYNMTLVIFPDRLRSESEIVSYEVSQNELDNL